MIIEVTIEQAGLKRGNNIELPDLKNTADELKVGMIIEVLKGLGYATIMNMLEDEKNGT